MSNSEENNNTENDFDLDQFNFSFEDLYRIKFKKIVKKLNSLNINVPKEVENKNQLIDFIKEKKIDVIEFKELFKTNIYYLRKSFSNKVIFWLEKNWNKFEKQLSKITFFNKSKKEKDENKNSNIESKDVEKKFLDEKEKKKKNKKWKFPNSLVIILSILLIFILITWIPHEPYQPPENTEDLYWNFFYNRAGGDFNGTFGLIDGLFAILAGFFQALPIILYLFTLGALLEILVDTGSFERGIGSTLKSLKNRKIIVIPILFVMFSAFGTIWGMQEEGIPYYSILVPFMILIGFTPITSIMILMLANTTGMMASVTNPFSGGVAISSLNPDVWGDTITIGSGILMRFVIWIVLTTTGATFVTWYALKHSEKEDPNFYYSLKDEYISKIDSELINEDYEIETLYRKDKWSLIAFATIILILIIGIIPWNIYDEPHYGIFDGHISNFFAGIGQWGFGELTILLFIGILLQIAINGPRKYPWTEITLKGARGMLSVSIIIGIARGASVVLTYSGMSAVFVGGLSKLPGQDTNYGFLMFIAISSLTIGTLIPSTSGSAAILFPVFSDLVAAPGTTPDVNQIHLMISSIAVFSMCLGLTNMFSPAQAVLLTSVESIGVSYGQYLKSIWGFVLLQALITIVIIIPALSFY